MTTDNDRYRAPALDKGLDILELLAEQPQGLTRAEIVKAMGRSQSEIYRMVERLVARQYVSRSIEGDRYALSLKLFVLGNRYPPVDRLVSRALPLMDKFSKATEQSCHLCMYDRGNLTVVAQVNSPGNWGLSIRKGADVSLIDTASGHVLLAFQTDRRRAEMLAEHHALEGEIPMASSELESIFLQVRALGRWQGASQQALGVEDISIPVLGPYREALAVLTCPFLKRIDRHVSADLDQACELLSQAAQGLSLAGERKAALAHQ